MTLGYKTLEAIRARNEEPNTRAVVPTRTDSYSRPLSRRQLDHEVSARTPLIVLTTTFALFVLSRLGDGFAQCENEGRRPTFALVAICSPAALVPAAQFA